MSSEHHPKAKIRVLCVEDHSLTRDGIRLRVDLEPDMEVIAAVGTGEEALELFERQRPDITLMDLQLPKMSGLDAIREIRAIDATARIVVLTMYEGDEDVYRALKGGAATYLLKDTLPDDLIRVMREVHAGGRPIPSAVAERLATRQSSPGLTPREVEVLELIARGMRNKEMAAVLHISEETVQVHARNIFAKLHVQDRAAALAVAMRRGILHIRSIIP